MNEFYHIERYIAPLSNRFGLNLKDDAAVIPGKNKYDYAITKDAIIEGVHFLFDTPPENIIHKLLRVNLSDIAAMGAVPKLYLISAALPKNTGKSWFESTTKALAKEQEEFGVILIGGDTTKHKDENAPAVLSLTMIGEIESGKALLRSGAQVDDDIYVSGTIGDGTLGLKICQGEFDNIPQEHKDFLINRYNIPQPRVTLGQALVGIANAAIDISDGLIADLEHICECSEVGAEINLNKIPISEPVQFIMQSDTNNHTDFLSMLTTGGDDYELLFTAHKDQKNNINSMSKKLEIKITQIGKITPDGQVIALDKNNQKTGLKFKGFGHF